MKAMLLILVGLSGTLFAQVDDSLSGKVVHVIDGNTLEVIAADNQTYRIKLSGINCPELGQDYGEKAKQYLEKLILDKPVMIRLQGKDRWGTQLAIVTAPGEIDPRNELLNKGLAWTTEVNPNTEFEAMKEKARENGDGLWKDKSPTPPWTFRRQQTMTKVKSS